LQKLGKVKCLYFKDCYRNVVGGNVTGSDDLGQDERLIIRWIYWPTVRLSASTELRVTIRL